jgi:2'-5' RNA ligase
MSKRLFVAIDLPEVTKELLTDLDPHMRGIRWVDSDQMHLTLGFFDDVSEDVFSKLRERLGTIDFRAFFLPVNGVGTFPSKGPPKIIWIGVGSGHPHLFQIHKRVQEAALAAGLEPELRPFHPHITLARCRDVSPQIIRKFLKLNVHVDLGMIRVDSFHLYSSKLTPAGPIHTRELTVFSSSSLASKTMRHP